MRRMGSCLRETLPSRHPGNSSPEDAQILLLPGRLEEQEPRVGYDEMNLPVLPFAGDSSQLMYNANRCAIDFNRDRAVLADRIGTGELIGHNRAVQGYGVATREFPFAIVREGSRVGDRRGRIVGRDCSLAEESIGSFEGRQRTAVLRHLLNLIATDSN